MYATLLIKWILKKRGKNVCVLLLTGETMSLLYIPLHISVFPSRIHILSTFSNFTEKRLPRAHRPIPNVPSACPSTRLTNDLPRPHTTRPAYFPVCHVVGVAPPGTPDCRQIGLDQSQRRVRIQIGRSLADYSCTLILQPDV